MSEEIEHKLLDELLSNINQVLFVRDAFTENHDVIYVNDAYERLWGRSKQSLKDNPGSYIDAVHPDDREMVVGLYMKFLQGNIEYEKDFRIIRADGEVRWMFAKTFAIFNDQGEVYRIAGVAEDITDRKTSELNVSRLNEVQSGVLKMLAHDLRTPIAGIKMAASLLPEADSDAVKNCTEQITESCDNTLLMMDDMLSHIQMNSEGIAINKSEFVIEDQIKIICKDFKDRMAQKNISLILPETSNKVKLDGLKFRQILSNLLTNAIKFSYPDGDIVIQLSQNNGDLQLIVKDSGIGVPQNMQQEVFQIFTKARREGTNGEKSTGLGLSITKRLVELHDGSISMKSTEGEGTEMIVSFPN
jgi:two-component system sensor histidine kinase VicK